MYASESHQRSDITIQRADDDVSAPSLQLLVVEETGDNDSLVLPCVLNYTCTVSNVENAA